jgi:hypothetical protein
MAVRNICTLLAFHCVASSIVSSLNYDLVLHSMRLIGYDLVARVLSYPYHNVTFFWKKTHVRATHLSAYYIALFLFMDLVFRFMYTRRMLKLNATKVTRMISLLLNSEGKEYIDSSSQNMQVQWLGSAS